MSDQPTIAVIGAGMVGTCCALYLQREGYEVTLIDRGEPGQEASSGNLGGFGIASCPPAAMPGVIKKVPAMLFDGHAPLKLRWGHVVKALHGSCVSSQTLVPHVSRPTRQRGKACSTTRIQASIHSSPKPTQSI